MTNEEKFIVDLEGYLVIKNVLTEDEIMEMNQIIDNGGRSGPPSRWGKLFNKLIDHPKILPYLIELIGPSVRLDHDYAIFMQNGSSGGGLHGGEDGGRPGGNEGDHWYKCRDGVIRNGLCVIAYNLAPVKSGDGGFACIPGSHKSNFLRNLPDDVRRFKRQVRYVVQPEVEVGDVVFFTEALIHGTMPWIAEGERRSLLYKYSPGHSAWSGNYYSLNDYEELSERQELMLAPPSIGGRPSIVLDEDKG